MYSSLSVSHYGIADKPVDRTENVFNLWFNNYALTRGLYVTINDTRIQNKLAQTGFFFSILATQHLMPVVEETSIALEFAGTDNNAYDVFVCDNRFVNN